MIMKKIRSLLIIALLVLTTTAWKPQGKGFKSPASPVPQTTLPAELKDNGNVKGDTLDLHSDSLAKEESDTLPSQKEEATDADIQTNNSHSKHSKGVSWLWVALPTLAFLLMFLAYRNVRRRYNRVKARLDDAEQQLADVRLLQNADKEQINKHLEQMEKHIAWLSREKTDAVRARQLVEEDMEKLLTELKSQQAENDQLCDKNMQLSKQLRQLTEQYSQLKADNTDKGEFTTDSTNETDSQKSETTDENVKSTTNLTNETYLSDRVSRCASLLDTICQQVQQTECASPVITATLRQMQTGLAEMQQSLHPSCVPSVASEQSSSASTLQQMQEIFAKCLRPSGWMNNAAQLFAYSRLPQLCTQLQQNGVNISMLEQLIGQVQAMLGTADMSMTIPAVLAADFDKDAYDYQNGDVWINKMFSGITSRDFEGKVFDILQVGYTIGNTKTKPIVKF